MADSIRVVATDLETGDTSEAILKPGQHVLVVAEPRYLASEQNHLNGTTVLTIKRRPREIGNG